MSNEMVPVNGYALDSDDFPHMVTYQALVNVSVLFWDTLRNFIDCSGRDFKVPIVNGKSLDLHRLFKEVTSRGGLERVIEDRNCQEVIDACKFRMTVNVSFALRKYLKMLYGLEHVYYFQGPYSYVVSSSFKEKAKALKRLIKKSENLGIDPHNLQPGVKVTAITDGKFESGYIVTMKIGSEVFKGVLYNIHQTPPETQRCKKISKSSSSNLSESDRKVYQEKGLEDVSSGAAETSASVDAAASTSGAKTSDWAGL